MGPSGAGKTTLLSALFGDKDLVAGSVHLSGEPLFANKRRSSRRRHVASQMGYVRQRDIFIESLTVRETLLFTARLRMPEATDAEVRARVNTVVDDMGLRRTLDTTIGSTMRRGISGGELKRVNVAAELLGMPKVLLLDEPTSGLDSTYALVVMRKLGSYVRTHGVGCLCTLHQPSAQILELVDRVVLMAPGGAVVFSGAPSELAAHLQLLALSPPEGHTLVDHAMQLLCDSELRARLEESWTGPAAPTATPATHHVLATVIDVKNAAVSTISGVGSMLSALPASLDAAAVLVRVSSGTRKLARRARLPFHRTVWLLARRQIRQSRSTLLKTDEIALNLLIGVITGVIWWQSAGSEAEQGALFFFVAHMTWWPGFLYLFAFPAEVAVLTKELLSDSYSIEAYLLSKLVADTPSEIVCPSVFFACALPMCGFPAAASVPIWLTMLLQFQTSASIGMLCSIVSDHPRFPVSANTLISAINVLQMCAGGFLRDPRTYPQGLGWLGYTSIFYYSSAIMSQVSSSTHAIDPRYSPLGLGANVAILLGITFGLRLSLYVALKCRDLRFA
uniref:ABC transporter domain-containing protein n=1 Tax=Coccolithus braarudii TaxID=221442 RepID=A0A7S0LP79_9EUKA